MRSGRFYTTNILRLAFFLIAIAYAGVVYTQQPARPGVRCATYESMEDFRRRNPNAATDEQFESWLRAKMEERRASGRTESVSYTIPIVFHIVHNGENPGTASNLSATKIAAQLEQLNKDFSNLSGSTYPVAADMQIQFCLALVAPDGSTLAEPGIDRINRSDKGWAAPPYNGDNSNSYVDNVIMPGSYWDPRKYFNIWTLDLSGSLGGKSTFPSGSTLSGLTNNETDSHAGVFVKYQTVAGSTNPTPWGIISFIGKILTHEAGHFFGLRHIWGDSPAICNLFPNLSLCHCNTDYCDDTPVQRDPTNGCPTIDSAQYLQNCAEIGDGNKRMFENHMDYSYDACKNTFTYDQKTRMQTVMLYSPRRVELASSTVCCPTADLIVTNPGASPSGTVAGNTITVSFSEKNIGHAQAGANYVNIHLSEDDVLTPGLNGDLYLGQYQFSQVLQAGDETTVQSTPITIPLSTAAGQYYIFFAADGSGVVNECKEDNNFATAIISVSEVQTPGQSAYRYWTDDNFQNRLTVNTSSGSGLFTIQRQVAVSSLGAGLHSFHFQFKGPDDIWSSVNSSFFYKSSGTYPAGSARYEYWFDNAYEEKTVASINSTSNLVLLRDIVVSELNPGLHLFNIHFKPDAKDWSIVSSSFFYQPTNAPDGQAQYEYWFDNDYANKTQVNSSATNNLLLLNNIAAGSLTTGLHLFHIRFRPDGKDWSTISSSFFYIPGAAIPGAAAYEYWVDDNYAGKTTIPVSPTNYISLLNIIPAGSLSTGLHTLHIRFKPDGKDWSVVSSNFFYKDNPALVPVNNLARYVYWYDSDWQHPQTITITGINDLNWTLHTDVASLTAGRHLLSFSIRDDAGHWSSIVSDSFTRAAITSPACLSRNQQFQSGVIAVAGVSYQWEADTGAGFAPLTDNTFYSGTGTATLTLTNVPTTWYGYKYRCIVTNGGTPVTGPVYTLKFAAVWTGAADNTWENAANWNCSFLPDENTDVYINAGLVQYPVVNSVTSCRNLFLQPGTALTVLSGQNLTVTGKQ